ncbi:hypothetical protein PseudUWO311_17090 [Pseudanabaena sp. UWO311]|uniref:YbjN domain-containing protein n=1 Tax=Pseudanabaena sp. UWO311 TaxID=2487337 RepID=UPI00115AED6F|nr:YbjN domain-containing protein [Pseudanabaena sp. UWO311]TYQ25039.1 hypothetical protein PseudUWO311_17090 [Pseudanabaena sp. UWO311]
MSELFDTVLGYFVDKGWPIEQHEELPVLRIDYEGEHGRWFCYARVNEEANQFIFLSTLSEKVSENKRISIAEYITRANFGLNIGNFEMDFDDGEIRYKTSIDVTYAQITFGLIDPLVNASLVAMDDYLPGIQLVLSGESTPSQAISQINEDDDDVLTF